MLQLTDVQKCSLSIAYTDAAGNPATVDGVPEWSSSDETVCTVTPATDGMSAVITTVGKLGTCQINVNADADMGAGVSNIPATLDVTVGASQATGAVIATGVPESRLP